MCIRCPPSRKRRRGLVQPPEVRGAPPPFIVQSFNVLSVVALPPVAGRLVLVSREAQHRPAVNLAREAPTPRLGRVSAVVSSGRVFGRFGTRLSIRATLGRRWWACWACLGVSLAAAGRVVIGPVIASRVELLPKVLPRNPSTTHNQPVPNVRVPAFREENGDILACFNC